MVSDCKYCDKPCKGEFILACPFFVNKSYENQKVAKKKWRDAHKGYSTTYYRRRKEEGLKELGKQ